MALPIPMKMNRDRFTNEAEYEVYTALHDQLGDDWVLISSMELRLDDLPGERELDLLLLHRYFGLVVIEVKSFAFYVQGGQFFYVSGQPVTRDPLAQVGAQRRYLARLLGDLLPNGYNDIRFAIASPKTIAVDGNLGPQLHQRQLLGAQDLVDVDGAIHHLCTADPYFEPLGDERFEEILKVLCPDATVVNSKAALRQLVRSKMEQRLIAETKVLESLDRNRRVLVLGGAGTGKTRLAVAWAKRAAGRGENVLFTMYNEPLAATLAEELGSIAGVRVSPFLRLLEEHCGVCEPDAVEEKQHYFDTLPDVARNFLLHHPPTFDTVIIDEAQDFPSHWFDLIEQLVVEGGRILAVADPRQNLGDHVFSVDAFREGWTQAELLNNNRNAPAIAQLLRRRLRGAPSPNKEPFAHEISWIRAESEEEIVAAVRTALGDSSDLETWVLTFRVKYRDRLVSELNLVRFDDRTPGAVVCETVRRMKGLDVARLIVVTDPLDADDVDELYTAISRAREELVVISSEGIGQLLGLTDQP